MNKKTSGIVIGIVTVVVLIVAGILALNLNKKNVNSEKPNTSDQSQKVDASKEFNPSDMSKLSYVATSTTTVSGQTVTSTIESNGKTQKTSSTVAGMKTESYVTGNEVVTCVNGTCEKQTVDTSSDASNGAVQNIAQYKNTAKYSGKETVDGVEYNVWKATGSLGEVTYYIDSQNRIGKMSFGSTVATYEYKDVTITVPTV